VLLLGSKKNDKNATISKESRRRHVSFADKESLSDWYEKTTFCNIHGQFYLRDKGENVSVFRGNIY
jgi:hypothetical protein